MLPSIILGLALFFTISVILSLVNVISISHDSGSPFATKAGSRLIRDAILFAAAWALYHYLTH